MSDVVIREHVPLAIRLLGGRWRDGKRQFRMRWGEIGFGRRGSAFDLIDWGADSDYCDWSLHVRALWIDAFIRLPFLRGGRRAEDGTHRSWGFTQSPDMMGLHLHWGDRVKIVTMPWRNWLQTAHDVRRGDGSWAPFVGSWEVKQSPDGVGKEPDGRLVEKFPYRYVLRSGEVQNVTASVHVERRVRKLKALRWLPFGRTSYAISVEFSGEVGERAGSWKGGVLGCGYALHPGETPRECLYRMQEERKF